MEALQKKYMQVKKAEWELILFSVFFVLWSQLILYKKLLLSHGPRIIWQNFPTEILATYFSKISILEAVYMIGELPFIMGLIIVFKYLFKDKNKEVHFLIAFALSTGLLLWLRLIPLTIGLMFLGLVLILLFATYYKVYLIYIQKTRFAKFTPILKVAFIVVFFLTSVFPSVSLAKASFESVPSIDAWQTLDWLVKNSDDDRAIFTSMAQGDLITYRAHRKNVIDPNFLGIINADERYEDYIKMASTPSVTQAVATFNKYKVKFLWISKTLKAEFGEPMYLSHSCFEKVFENKSGEVYKVTCKLQDL